MKDYNLQQVLALLDEELTLAYEKYVKWHENLNEFRDKKLETPELVDEVNTILTEIQQGFKDIYPTLFWVQQRQEFTSNVIKEYNAFIENLKAGGAQFREDNEPEAPKC